MACVPFVPSCSESWSTVARRSEPSRAGHGFWLYLRAVRSTRLDSCRNGSLARGTAGTVFVEYLVALALLELVLVALLAAIATPLHKDCAVRARVLQEPFP